MVTIVGSSSLIDSSLSFKQIEIDSYYPKLNLPHSF